jgi:hypothetical protein
MRKPVLSVTSAAAIILTIYSAAMPPMNIGTAAAAPAGNGATRVPLTPILRYCDSTVSRPTNFGIVGTGEGEAFIVTHGNTVVAQVQFVNARFPGMHYDVGLIQVPRPTSSPCGPGAPDTAYTGMDLDAAGRATVTISDQIHPGTTGVWVKIDRPSPHSQLPAEYYSSRFVAQI